MKLNFDKIVPRFDEILSRGLSKGLGERDGQMCIEAAICCALDLPHGDNPDCVTTAVIRGKICLNDSNWSSKQARAKELRLLGIAQLGSKGIVDDIQYSTRLSELTIRVLIPTLFREPSLKATQRMLDTATLCEKEGSKSAADAAAVNVANAAYAANAAAYAAAHAAANAAAYATYAAKDAANAAVNAANAAARNAAKAAAYAAAAKAAADAANDPDDKYLILSASLMLQVLQELRSPGAIWLEEKGLIPLLNK